MIKYSQNFLTDLNIRDRIIESAQIKREETVLEVGPGKGILTEVLIGLCHLIAIEKDPAMCSILTSRFPTLDLYNQDVLDTDLTPHRKAKLISNLPYQITKPFLLQFLASGIKEAVIMVQKEVADKLTENLVSSYFVGALQSSFHIEKICTVPPSSFSPAPKIHSSVLRFTRFQEHPRSFFKILQLIFQKRRKMLSSSLSKLFPKLCLTTLLQELDISLSARPQDVNIQKFTTLIQEILKNCR